MFTTEERRVLLDLIDLDNSRDRVMHNKGRTTPEVWAAQDKLYWTIRNKLVVSIPTDSDQIPTLNPPPI